MPGLRITRVGDIADSLSLVKAPISDGILPDKVFLLTSNTTFEWTGKHEEEGKRE